MGEKIWSHKQNDADRNGRVLKLNDGELDVIVMSERVGGCGHTMIGASHMIFLGSLYQWSSEKQAIGDLLPNRTRLAVARMCRQGQLAKVIKAYILADDTFAGDRMAMSMKKERKEKEIEMTRPMLKEDWWVFGHVDKLRFSEEEFRERVEQEKAAREEEAQRIRAEREAMQHAKVADILAQRPGATPANPYNLDTP